MSFRKFLFWLHLVAGVVAGLAIAVMCLTGTVLAFEKQLLARAERDTRLLAAPPAGTARLSLDELTRRVRAAHPDTPPTALIVSADPRAAVAFALGRDTTLYADPYTGEFRSPSAGARRLRAFLRTMEDWHRWLALSGDSRPVGKLVNGSCNAAFLLLAVTGLYLWLPRSWSWRSVRAIAFFNPKFSGKARDFNWHNVIGLWSAPILIVLTLTALPMSFRWANNLVYQLAGETPPAPGAPGGGTRASLSFPPPTDGTPPLGRDAQFAAVQKEFPAWEQITLRLAGPGGRSGPPGASRSEGPRTDSPRAERANATPGPRADRAERPSGETGASPQPSNFTVKLPGVWPRIATTAVVLNPFTGEILRREAFSDLTAGRQARTWTRFLHTGEALGWLGQLVAGLASLGGCFLVYTGFALAWRRFFCRTSA